MFLTALKKGGGIQLVNRLFFCTAFFANEKRRYLYFKICVWYLQSRQLNCGALYEN